MIQFPRRTRPVPAAVLSLSLSLALLLGGCTPGSQEPAAPAVVDPAATPVDTRPSATAEATPPLLGDDDDMPRICNADAVQGLVGQEATEALVARATADSGSASVRVLKPGDAATMDFREDRLNIDTDDAGVIQRISCG
ncbi:I78 family peptidase inhibitor [Luteimonas saliphila]|uniref:I78 family peptidase inhibitor n=1 Tax=Luteimonas saliphila TaxID=2804919 RepID=UPI00192DBA35|nr:I78 family peptidase inhibitor [Luteimonas saliphila]